MISSILKGIFGTRDSRIIKRLSPVIDKINSLEKDMKNLSDEELKNKRLEFISRLENGESEDDILPEAFAVVREASVRVFGMRHFDVQLIGGIIIHQGKIAEMKTGEGKTLVSTCPVYLNSLRGRGVHVVTVNDYLAKRDKEWMESLYVFLGLKVGVILSNMSQEDRREAYNCDVVYGTNNEFGFDYLRDNMRSSLEDCVQRDLNFAIVDEVDSILVDEARTPLIISGGSKGELKIYEQFAAVVKKLKDVDDYVVDRKEHSVLLAENGIDKVEKILKLDNLYSPENVSLTHYLNQALKAKELYKKDRDYIIKDSKIVIVDEFTGRLMEGRRYSEGLHQSIEAKEKVTIASENVTLASITLQNYFRIYKKLSGMTGTAKTEEAEFVEIYGLDVVAIPTNRPVIRKDLSDLVFITERAKTSAIVDKICEIHKEGQPLLVGTASIDSSEKISKLLKSKKVPHNVLNAKNHKREAEIIAQAGRIGAVTIATNMAGRGTDIVLGGNPEVLAKNTCSETSPKYIERVDKFREECRIEREKILSLGGLFVLGTERHESRRIDNQLRGRSGRQGDPGVSLFYLSLDDDLMKMFGSENSSALMKRLGYDENEAIEHPLINSSIESAQKRVEAINFGTRKQLLEYDNVMNRQREVIYKQRSEIMRANNLGDKILAIFERVIKLQYDMYINVEFKKEDVFREYFKDKIGYEVKGNIDESIVEKLSKELFNIYDKKMGNHDRRSDIERNILIRVIDGRWRENISNLESLKEGIHLKSYSQKDPIVEYKLGAFDLYRDMSTQILEEIFLFLFKIEV